MLSDLNVQPSTIGGPRYKVSLSQRDARNGSFSDALRNLPPQFLNFSHLLSSLQFHVLNLMDLVALPGGHTIGLAR
ncbi:hypothetical protein K2173_023316 [Erythroxylum novogranatense]|uniref:peroxidase n=1 Tax=Erythroxylum novogranatense TaxID=1862640 RepID=A0AAV8T9Y8_9ROSI|nr:hypothetical protein K2173_023316 [Erythroxylum novogranatense]